MTDTPDQGQRQDLWLGIDLGTQGVRALAVTGEGRVRGRGSAPLTGDRDGDEGEDNRGRQQRQDKRGDRRRQQASGHTLLTSHIRWETVRIRGCADRRSPH